MKECSPSLNFSRVLRFALYSLLYVAQLASIIDAQDGKNSSAQQNPSGFRLASDKGYVRVPFYLYGNNILVRTRINNSKPIWLIFDSGASVNVINGRNILERLARMPIQTWNYNSDRTGLRHMGPMAQDFRAAFGLGADDKHINLIDEGGVTMAAIKELYRVDQAKGKQINDLTDRVEALEKLVEKLTGG